VIDYKNKTIGITSNNNSLVLALSLRRQREKSNSTVRQASARLGSKSPNAYAQYERGKTRISLDQYERLLQAVNPKQNFHLRVV
jgi:transcriptional regulator with XRE-family HTH domain